MSDEPEFVDVTALPLIADEEWYRRNIDQIDWPVNGNGARSHALDGSTWVPSNLGELPETPPVEPTLGGIGIVYPGKRHVFSGPQESAKTLAAYAIGLEVVRAGDPVVLVDFEMGPYDARTRLRELGASPGEIASFLYVEPSESPTEADTAALVARAPQLVIIDASAGAFAVSGLDDNKRADVELWARRWVDPFRKAGIATIVLDHVVKSSESRGTYAIGSERKVGGADVHLGFEVRTPIKRGGHGLYRIVTHKDRGGFLKRGRLRDFELESDEESHAISWTFVPVPEYDDDAPFRPTQLMDAASVFIEKQPEAISRREVERNVPGNAAALRIGLDILTDEGYLEELAGPRNARLVRSVRAYRQADETSASGVRPSASETGHSRSASLRPTPYGGDAVDALAADGETRSDADDLKIPF